MSLAEVLLVVVIVLVIWPLIFQGAELLRDEEEGADRVSSTRGRR
jgi:hypothetical protein